MVTAKLTRRLGIGILVILALAVCGAIGFRVFMMVKMAGMNPFAGRGPTPVIAAPVTATALANRIEVIGTAKAFESVELTATVSDRVKSIAFTDGGVVETGDVLVTFENSEEAADLNAAKADLDDKKRALERDLSLFKKGTVSKEKLETAMFQAKTARARYDKIAAQMSDRVMRAPFSGVVGLRDVSVGSLVRPGDKITTIDAIEKIKLDFNLPEVYVNQLAVGQKVKARSPALDQPVTGVVASLSSRVDPATRTFTVRSVIANDQLEIKPGMLLGAEIYTGTRSTLVIPEQALVQQGTLSFVYLIASEEEESEPAEAAKDKRLQAKMQRVEVGERRPGFVEVTGGLKSGQLVVAEGALKLRGGGPVKVTQQISVKLPQERPVVSGAGPSQPEPENAAREL